MRNQLLECQSSRSGDRRALSLSLFLPDTKKGESEKEGILSPYNKGARGRVQDERESPQGSEREDGAGRGKRQMCSARNIRPPARVFCGRKGKRIVYYISKWGGGGGGGGGDRRKVQRLRVALRRLRRIRFRETCLIARGPHTLARDKEARGFIYIYAASFHCEGVYRIRAEEGRERKIKRSFVTRVPVRVFSRFCHGGRRDYARVDEFIAARGDSEGATESEWVSLRDVYREDACAEIVKRAILCGDNDADEWENIFFSCPRVRTLCNIIREVGSCTHV